ncbi:uncharacterized protein TRIREDRAFT_102619 [Trichoderma reesei QM6a]|uniref:Predicted protein n=1 Tax=Hypocrea jecorina (strain QM6a) TaxID=431241 RepID=G0R7F6_HYPJQ|nr:uncharacterized protein TRIREDRAFT_102619 [Trichoderma reesei QM6a]EGR52245.1 predicted protein [Trichoderma reesei QM6a]
MSAQQANLNLQYQQQLQQQQLQQPQLQQHSAQQITQQPQLQQPQPQLQQPQLQQQRRKNSAQQPAKKKTFPTVVSPGMRDRQARGKNTHRKHEDDVTDEDEYDDDDDGEEEEEGENGQMEGIKNDKGEEEEEESEDDETNSSSFSYRSEPFEMRERRAYALAVLDRPEQLMMYANTTNDSVAGQRVRFTRMMCGFDDETDWRNNLHYKAALAAAKERQIKVRRGASLPRDF